MNRSIFLTALFFLIFLFIAGLAFWRFSSGNEQKQEAARSMQVQPRQPAPSSPVKIPTPSPEPQAPETPQAPAANAAIRGAYGDWQIRCETAGGPNGEQCFLTQSVVAKDRPNVGLVIITGRIGPEKIEILRVVAPLGVLLPMGLGIRLDDQVIGAMDFVRCSPVACIAETRLSNNDLLKKLKAAKNLNFLLFLTPDEGISVPISLNGFNAGYDQLK